MATALGKQTGRARLPLQSRDRRPALAALALLLIVGGGLGAGLIVYRTGQQVDVLAASTTIRPGDVVTAGDLSTVRVSGADGNTIAAANRLSASEYNWAEHPTERNPVVGGLAGSVA